MSGPPGLGGALPVPVPRFESGIARPGGLSTFTMERVIMKRLLVAATALVLFGTATAFAHGYKAGPIDIDHPWARATAPSAPTGAAYFALHNTGKEDDRLVSASTPVAEKAELHTHLMDNGVMKMRPVNAVEVATGSQTVLAPGGLHVMLIGLKQPLVKGKAFPLTLVFEKAGPTTVQVDVQGAGETAPAHQGHGEDHPKQ